MEEVRAVLSEPKKKITSSSETSETLKKIKIVRYFTYGLNKVLKKQKVCFFTSNASVRLQTS